MTLKNKKNNFKKYFGLLKYRVVSAVFFVSSIIILGPIKVFASPATDQALSDSISAKINLVDPLKSTTDLNGFIKNILDGVVLILTPVLVIMVVYSGYLFVSAQGKTEKLTEAKKALMYTLVGAAIVLGAVGLQRIIGNTVNAIAPIAQ